MVMLSSYDDWFAVPDEPGVKFRRCYLLSLPTLDIHFQCPYNPNMNRTYVLFLAGDFDTTAGRCHRWQRVNLGADAGMDAPGGRGSHDQWECRK